MAEVSNRPTASDINRDTDTEQKAQPQEPFYRRPAVLIIGGIVIVIGLLLGLRYYLHARSHESTDDAFIDGEIIQISPKVAGHVLKLHVTDNQHVKQGDLL